MIDLLGLGLTHLFASVIAELPFVPTTHVHYAEAVLRLRDGLPKYRDFPVELGGTGTIIPE